MLEGFIRDEEDYIEEAYTLEVSSPGLDGQSPQTEHTPKALCIAPRISQVSEQLSHLT